MPRNVNVTTGVSPREVLTNSGGEQFLAIVTGTGPIELTITYANLPDGTDFAGTSSFTGNPAWTNGATNYIWFNTTSGLLENDTAGFASGTDIIPLWRLTLDGGGALTSLFDSRPWFSSEPIGTSSLGYSLLLSRTYSVERSPGFSDDGDILTVAGWPTDTKMIRITCSGEHSGGQQHTTGEAIIQNINVGSNEYDIDRCHYMIRGTGTDRDDNTGSATGPVAGHINSGAVTGGGTEADNRTLMEWVDGGNEAAFFYLDTVNPATQALEIGQHGISTLTVLANLTVEFWG